MSEQNLGCKPKEPRVQIRMLPQLERELAERAKEQGQTLNAFLRPYLYAIARKEVRLEAVVTIPKLLPKTPVRHG